MASPPGTRSASQQAAASSARSSSDYPPSAFLQVPFQVRGRVPASIGFPEQRVAQTHDAGHVFQSDRPDPHLGVRHRSPLWPNPSSQETVQRNVLFVQPVRPRRALPPSGQECGGCYGRIT